ncbi:MAG TPA: hypothetical protein VFI73_05720 [Candidatus Nitrosopolaris sp.]|nr:hypothetical protein [Candidatus Nitrosopolaris sp.]
MGPQFEMGGVGGAAISVFRIGSAIVADVIISIIVTINNTGQDYRPASRQRSPLLHRVPSRPSHWDRQAARDVQR